MKRIEHLEYKDTTFLKLLKDFTIGRLFLNYEFVFSLLISYFAFLVLDNNIGLFPIFGDTLINYLISITSTIFAIEVAGFSITLGLADKDFLVYLWKKRIISKLFFPFWWVSLIWVIALIAQFTSLFILNLGGQQFQLITVCLSMFFTLYALFFTLSIIGSIFRFAIIRAFFTSVKNKSARKP